MLTILAEVLLVSKPTLLKERTFLFLKKRKYKQKKTDKFYFLLKHKYLIHQREKNINEKLT